MLVLAPRIPSDSVGYNANKIDLEALKADNKSCDEKCNHAMQLWPLGEICPHIQPCNPWEINLRALLCYSKTSTEPLFNFAAQHGPTAACGACAAPTFNG